MKDIVIAFKQPSDLLISSYPLIESARMIQLQHLQFPSIVGLALGTVSTTGPVSALSNC